VTCCGAGDFAVDGAAAVGKGAFVEAAHELELQCEKKVSWRAVLVSHADWTEGRSVDTVSLWPKAPSIPLSLKLSLFDGHEP